MSGALYGLIGALTAFVLLVLVTLAALVLSLRRGPPTALMGLLGGFCAPYISGLGPDAAGPLLIYLAIFTAGLYALAIHRGWLWLALLASGGSVLWSSALMLLGVGNAAPLLGLFIVALAVAGTVALARIGEDYPQRDMTGPGLRGPLLRIAPIAAGLVQLAVFAPLIDFTLIGWLFYAALSAFALVMAWRDARLTPAAVGALLLVLVLLAGAIESGMDVRGVWWVAAITASLFGLPGQWLAFRARDGGLWALLAAGAPAGAFAVLFFGLPSAILSPLGWGLLAVVAGLPAGLLAWRASRAHIETADPDEPAARYWWSAGPVFPLRLGTATAAALALVPAITWAPDTLEAAALLLIPLAMLGWQRHVGGTALRHMEIVPLLIGLLALGDAFRTVRGDFRPVAGGIYRALRPVAAAASDRAATAAAGRAAGADLVDAAAGRACGHGHEQSARAGAALVQPRRRLCRRRCAGISLHAGQTAAGDRQRCAVRAAGFWRARRSYPAADRGSLAGLATRQNRPDAVRCPARAAHCRTRAARLRGAARAVVRWSWC